VESYYEEGTLEEDGEDLDVAGQVFDGEVDGESTVIALVTLVTGAVAVASKPAGLSLLVAVDRFTVIRVGAVGTCEAHIALALTLALSAGCGSIAAAILKIPAEVFCLAGVSHPS